MLTETVIVPRSYEIHPILTRLLLGNTSFYLLAVEAASLVNISQLFSLTWHLLFVYFGYQNVIIEIYRMLAIESYYNTRCGIPNVYYPRNFPVRIWFPCLLYLTSMFSPLELPEFTVLIILEEEYCLISRLLSLSKVQMCCLTNF
jgi:hypothetical protein